MVTRHQRIPNVIQNNSSIANNDNDHRNDWSNDSRFSLEANNSKSLIELHKLHNSSGHKLKRHIYHKPDNDFSHSLECKIYPLHLEPMKLDTNYFDMPLSSYYELHPHPKYGPNYNRDYSMISVKVGGGGRIDQQEYCKNIENNNEHQEYFIDEKSDCEGNETCNIKQCPDGFNYCLKSSRNSYYGDKHQLRRNGIDNTADESILAGLQTVANMVELKSTKKKANPKASLLRSRQNSPDRSFYNRNVITSSNTMDYLTGKTSVNPTRDQSRPRLSKTELEEFGAHIFRSNENVNEMDSHNLKKSDIMSNLISKQILLNKSSSNFEGGPCNYIYGKSSKSLVYYNAACGTTGSNKSDVSVDNSEDLHSNKETVQNQTSHVSFKSVSTNSTPIEAPSPINNNVSIPNLFVDKSCSALNEDKTHSVEIQCQEDDPTTITPKYLTKKISSCRSKIKSKGDKISVLSVANFKPVEIQTVPIETQDKAVSPPKKLMGGQNPITTGASKTETGKSVPNQVRYAQTVISVFDNYTIYEVMKSSTYKPKNLSTATEGVFVVKS